MLFVKGTGDDQTNEIEERIKASACLSMKYDSAFLRFGVFTILRFYDSAFYISIFTILRFLHFDFYDSALFQ